MGTKRHSDITKEHDNGNPHFDVSSPAPKKSKNEPNTANGPKGKQDVDYYMNILTIESYAEESRMITNEMVITESYDDSLFSALAAYSQRQGNIEKVDAQIVQKIRQHVVNFATRSTSTSTPPPFTLALSMEENDLQETKDKDEHHITTFTPKTNTNPIQSIWSKYCHPVYIQHHAAFEEKQLTNNLPNNLTMALTLESENETGSIHLQGPVKEMYKTYMLNSETPGSLMEVIFASMRYDLNTIVVQYLEKLNKYQVYNINPHLKNKIYLLNTADIQTSGKWRHLDNQIFQEKTNHISKNNKVIPVGIYMKQINDTSLVIRQAEAALLSTSVTKFDSALFNRLLLGTVKIEECTFHTENPEFHGYNYISTLEIPNSLYIMKQVQEKNELRQIFKGRPIESHSVFPFKSQEFSTENNGHGSEVQFTNEHYQQQQDQHPVTLNIMLDILNLDNELGVIQLENKKRNAIDNSKRCQYRQTDLQYNAKPEKEDKIQNMHDNQCNNYEVKTTKRVNDCKSKVRFTRVKNNEQVAIAVIAKAEYGNPQILIQLHPDAKLTYESDTIMYFMTLASSSICVQHYDFKRNQWQPSELKTGNFNINPGVCFRLHNTNKDIMQIRCSWFIKNTECNSNLNN